MSDLSAWLARGDVDGASRTSSRSKRTENILVVVAVLAAVTFSLVELRAETANVPYLNDSSVHEEMVRFALQRIKSGHLPLTSWFPFLGLGSPQYLHYQSLGVILLAFVSLPVGVGHAFPWSLYLLLATWPISVYFGARLLGWERLIAASAAVCAPFVVSAIGIGYEQQSYLWSGFGVWSQLWAMWTLPLAWGFTWRALTERRHVFAAVVFTAATIAFHFLTGYLAFLPILFWPFVGGKGLLGRLRQMLLVAGGTLLVSAWVFVPVIAEGKWASINEFLQNGPDANSYGARHVFSWLVSGDVFDNGRLPVITVLVGIGLIEAIRRARHQLQARALLIVFGLSLVLFCGRTTFGPLFDLLPGNKDLFLRRFIMGVQLSGLVLAGLGAWLVGQLLTLFWHRLSFGQTANGRVLGQVLLVATAIVVLAPAWSQLASYDHLDAENISYQRTQDAIEEPEINTIIDTITKLGGGRVFAGVATDAWAANFDVGEVPVFKYLSTKDIDEVGYTLRTASLMTDPEAYFDEYLPADYSLFGIRYLVLPDNRQPPVPATRIEQRGPYVLWSVADSGYLQVVDTVPGIAATRADLGAATASFVRSNLASAAIYPTMSFNGSPAATPTLTRTILPHVAPGKVLSSNVDLEDGTAQVRVSMRRTGVVVLKASYDPGWHATIDGAHTASEMVAPAYVAVKVPAGNHVVTFRYFGYPDYPELFGLVVAAIIGFGIAEILLRRRRSQIGRRRSEAT